MPLNITHTPGTVHDDGEAMSPDEARKKAAALIVASYEAEGCPVANLEFRAPEHTGELLASDHNRDQRPTEH